MTAPNDIDYFDPNDDDRERPAECFCPRCGKDFEDWSELGCESCDARTRIRLPIADIGSIRSIGSIPDQSAESNTSTESTPPTTK